MRRFRHVDDWSALPHIADLFAYLMAAKQRDKIGARLHPARTETGESQMPDLVNGHRGDRGAPQVPPPRGAPRKRPLPPALRANLWKKGQSGNPAGTSAAYHQCVRLAREASPEAMETLLQVMRESDDDRVKIVAATGVLDRAWGKPKEMVEEPVERPRPDLSCLSNKDRARRT